MTTSPNFGGQELRIVEEMAWFRQRGHHVWLAAAADSDIQKAARQKELPVIPIRIRGSINPLATARLLAACRRLGVELLVARGSRETACAWPVSLALRLPLVRYQHICHELKEGFFQKLLWCRAADEIVAASESIRRRLRDQNLAGEKSIHVLGEYVDRTMFHPRVSAGDLRARYGIPADACLIINVGMFRPDKGQSLLVAAADEILRKHPQCWFMLVGSPTRTSSSNALLESIRNSPQAGRFVLTGFQSEIAAHLAASDLVCLTSQYEAQSKIIPQAFAMGKLVVAPNIGGIPELLHHERNGLLYDREKPGALAAAIDSALNCDRAPLIANALADAERLDIDRLMNDTEQLYATLIK